MTAPDPSKSIVRTAYVDVADRLAKARGNIGTLLAPYGMQAERFEQIVLECLRATPTLLQCEPTSIIRSVYYAAEIGLELGGPLGDAYLVPYWNKKLRRKEAKCIPGYRGLLHVAHEADPEIDRFDADVIYEADEYIEERGSLPAFRVIPARFTADRGARIGVFACCYRRPTQYGPRLPQYAVMTTAEVEAIKAETLDRLEEWQRSQSPWTLHENEMWKKTSLRRLVKMMNLRGTRASLALMLDDEGHRPVREATRTRADDLKERLGKVPEEAVEAEAEVVE